MLLLVSSAYMTVSQYCVLIHIHTLLHIYNACIGTYKSMSEKSQSVKDVHNLLQYAKVSGHAYDVLPFLRSGSGMMSDCLHSRKQVYKTAWDALLLAMGYTEETIRLYDEMKPFYRNVYIIKSIMLRKLIQFMNRAMDIVDNNESVNVLFKADSSYTLDIGDKEIAMRVFGTPYFQLHPFLFERLPSFYLHSIHAKICHDTSGVCQYNA